MVNKNAKTQQQKKPKVNQEELKKQKEKEEQYKKLEAYINESGLSLAFNIIFAELIAKQILPENFFTYTAMRLKQIGKEIEGMKTKVPMYIDKPEVEEEGKFKRIIFLYLIIYIGLYFFLFCFRYGFFLTQLFFDVVLNF